MIRGPAGTGSVSADTMTWRESAMTTAPEARR
jgi:hypothetical protein